MANLWAPGKVSVGAGATGANSEAHSGALLVPGNVFPQQQIVVTLNVLSGACRLQVIQLSDGVRRLAVRSWRIWNAADSHCAAIRPICSTLGSLARLREPDARQSALGDQWPLSIPGIDIAISGSGVCIPLVTAT